MARGLTKFFSVRFVRMAHPKVDCLAYMRRLRNASQVESFWPLLLTECRPSQDEVRHPIEYHLGTKISAVVEKATMWNAQATDSLLPLSNCDCYLVAVRSYNGE